MNTITWIYTIMFFFGIYFLLMFIILFRRNRKLMNYYPEPKKFFSVSFLVPAYNEEESIKETLKALLEVDYPLEKKEIIVINDGSKDRTARVVKEFSKKYKQIKLLNKQNSGKADSLNNGIKIAKGELIAVVDADSYPTKDSLKKMVGYFEEDLNVAAVTSRVFVKNNKNFIERYQDLDYRVIAWSRKIMDYINCVYVTNGPLSVYRKDLVKKVGGFDPKNMTEDIEITWNLLSHGHKTKMSYSAIVYTTTPDTFKVWNKQRIRWNLGGLQTLNKYKGFFLKGENLFGYFVMSYVSLSFLLSLVGFFLLLRYLFIKLNFYVWSIPFFLKGYNPFIFFEFNFLITLLFLFGALFFVLSLVYYRYAMNDVKFNFKTFKRILVYTFIYRPLYLIPLIISIYKLMTGKIGWYTK